MRKRSDYGKFYECPLRNFSVILARDTGDFLGRALLTWMKQNSAFRLFLERYKDKVRAKLRNCDTEDKRQKRLACSRRAVTSPLNTNATGQEYRGRRTTAYRIG